MGMDFPIDLLRPAVTRFRDPAKLP
jgi:hypothetical protein